jgi:hypothetical protein
MTITKNISSLFTVILLILFATSPIYSQTERELQREKERQAVKEYMNSILSQRQNTQPEQNAETKDDLEKKYNNKLSKITGAKDRKHYFMTGNNIAVEVYNYGGIAPGYDLIRNVNNGVWRGLSYIFQFCPLVAASVPSGLDPNQQLHIISDGLWDYPGLREFNPDDPNELWSFQPLPGYADPNQEYMASNPAEDRDGDGKPDSWPHSWYNPILGKYVWPGFLAQDATNADLEVFWAMDDRDNKEFPYYPFPSDSTRKGLGIQIDGRGFQWSNALAENTIFFVYTITNVSEKDLDTVYFGIYGDPDLGGGSPENTDDHGLFIPPYDYDGKHDVSNIPVYARSMVYFWDPDMKGNLGLPLGYIGCKFLESPGNAENGIDDDGDGMIDERQDDGIDNDGDWNPLTDDVGIDGIPNTGDEGEGDGVPTAGRKLPDGSLHPLYPGEPNFELTDLDESDQIGLTSFNSWSWNTDKVSNDESMWNRIQAHNFSDIQQNQDIVFIFGSGPISLKKGETKRISMALLFGEDLDDLLITAETVQRIYNANYRFFKPPAKPKVTAVPGDKKVTLFWDTKAEESVDPITGKDFEGYVIYRSTDPSFGDIQNITDGKGSKFFLEPLKDLYGNEAKWDIDYRDEPYIDENLNGRYDEGEPYTDINLDGKWTAKIKDWWKGYHPVTYQGRGIQYYLGNNTGLVHSFVDSNNVINGQTYYYAVVAYDHGDSVGIPPSETTRKITVDPITSRLQFDENTVMVIPGPRASGYVAPSSDIYVEQTKGIGTGRVKVEILNDLSTLESGEYKIFFADSIQYHGKMIPRLNYSVLRMEKVNDNFTLYDTNFTKLTYTHLADDLDIVVKDGNGTVYTRNVDYVIDSERGIIRRTSSGSMTTDKTYSISYNYYPVYYSSYLNDDDGNPVFDGVSVKVKGDPVLELDTIKTGWVEGNSNYSYVIQKGSIGAGKHYAADYQIQFSSSNIDSALIQVPGKVIKVPVKYSVKKITQNESQQPILTFLKEKPASFDSAWTQGEEIILFVPNAIGQPTETTWGVIISKPTDTLITSIAPTEGDVFVLATKRPFNKEDEFAFKTTAAKYNSDLSRSRLDKIYVVPNPYVGHNEIEPVTKLPGQTRGERRIYFENLPPKCTIRIYTLSGEFVQSLEHESTLENGREYWNLLNRDGFGVAYGVYFAHIDAPGIGEKLIKFALIK